MYERPANGQVTPLAVGFLMDTKGFAVQVWTSFKNSFCRKRGPFLPRMLNWWRNKKKLRYLWPVAPHFR
jgi:glycerol uptake facilitator-like aquaporin